MCNERQLKILEQWLKVVTEERQDHVYKEIRHMENKANNWQLGPTCWRRVEERWVKESSQQKSD